MSPPVKKAKLSKDSGSIASALPVKSPKWKPEKWAQLHLGEATMKALESLEFGKPTDIQKEVIPIALEKGLDVLGAAETGSGKTLAFAIPIFEKWLRLVKEDENCASSKGLFAIVVTPTRELAMQIKDQFKCLTKFCGKPTFKTIAVVGGLSVQKQERLLKTKPQVIVATPGRLWSIIDMGDDHLDDLSNLKVLVVDEIDRMLEKGHFEELDKIVQRINCFGEDEGQKLGNRLQTMIFSATLTFTRGEFQRPDGTKIAAQTPGMKIKKLAEEVCLRKNKYQIVDLTKATSTPQSLVECRMNCADLQQKDTNVYYVLNRYKGRTLIFFNSIDATRRLYGLLKKLKFQPAPLMLHAKMQEQKRLKNFDKFAAIENSVLLATDVAARGLDIKDVDNVIHYQVPKTTEGYVHRSGRTARAFKAGRSVLLVDPADVQLYHRIRKNLKRKNDLDVLEVDCQKLFEACDQRVAVATEFESTEFRLKKVSSRKEWFKKAAEEMDIILDEDLIGNDDEDEEANPELVAMRRRRKKAEKALNAALSRPLPSIKEQPKVLPEVLLNAPRKVPKESKVSKK